MHVLDLFLTLSRNIRSHQSPGVIFVFYLFVEPYKIIIGREAVLTITSFEIEINLVTVCSN